MGYILILLLCLLDHYYKSMFQFILFMGLVLRFCSCALVFSIVLVQCQVCVFVNCFLFYFKGLCLMSVFLVSLPLSR